MKRYWISKYRNSRKWAWLEIVDGDEVIKQLNLTCGGECNLKILKRKARYHFYEWKKEFEDNGGYYEHVYKEIDEIEAFEMIMCNGG